MAAADKGKAMRVEMTSVRMARSLSQVEHRLKPVPPCYRRMPKIYLCFLWHMHQPFYKDLVSGEYRLPWTRMHALKDYYGMVRILEDYPGIRQTFNLVPSMIVQVEEYARGEALDPFLTCALKPAEELTPNEQAFILRNFFMAHP